MLRTLILGAAVSLSALVALPAAAQAQDGYYRDGYSHDGYYDRGYRSRDRYDNRYRGYRRYRPGDYYGRGYARRGYYPQAYYGRTYYNDGYYNNGYRRGYRCDGTTGAIVGAGAGALIGREIARDGRGYRYNRYGRRGGNGATGAILGGVVGALIGREASRC